VWAISAVLILVSSFNILALPQPRSMAPYLSPAAVWKEMNAGRPTISGSYRAPSAEPGTRSAP